MSKNDVIEALRNFCDDEDLDFTEDYSGRYMYGKKCIGFICDDVINSVIHMTEYLVDEFQDTDNYEYGKIIDTLGTAKTDSMGMSSIVYFPYLSID